MANPIVPQWVRPGWLTKHFYTTGSAPALHRDVAVYVTSQPVLDDLVTQAAADRVDLEFSTTNPTPTGSGSTPQPEVIEEVMALTDPQKLDLATALQPVLVHILNIFVPEWQQNTSYTANQGVLNPSGQLRVAKTSFTSGTTYNESNWKDPLASVYSPNLAPAPATSQGGTRTKGYDPVRYVYNSHGSNVLKLKNLLGRAAANSALVTLGVIGDSKTAGFVSGAIVGANAWPNRLGAILTGRGFSNAGDLVICNQNAPNGNDTRWTNSNWAAGTGSLTQQFYAQSSAAGATRTFTSSQAGTTAGIYMLANSGAAFTFTVDGAIVATGVTVTNGTYTAGTGTVTPNGSNNICTVAITGLSNATHTIVVTAPTATVQYCIGAYVGPATGLRIANYGVYGTKANDWVNTIGTWYKEFPMAQTLPCDFLWMNLGINDANGGRTSAQFNTDMQTLITSWVGGGRACGLIVPTPPATAQVPAATWNQFVSVLYDLAASNDLPLVDLGDAFGNSWTNANAAGLMTDNLHESVAGYGADALIMAGVMGA
jgi:hypothetical protein